MRPLTLHVLRIALRQARLWRSQGMSLGIAVNLSARSLLEPTLVDDVVRLLREASVSPKTLTLEITESDILEDPMHAVEVLRRLEEHGIHRSVDDFGTGYSSLSYLNRLPVDEMKIDRSFVQGMSTDADAAAIVGAVVDLGRRLGKRTVAEGVETEQHWQQLVALGCDIAQGFLMGRPLEGDQLVAWARAWTAPAPVRALRPLQQA
jgi:EAL domain-containing protein (putative c-di-GMP-specific phosphodiesterase class I)